MLCRLFRTAATERYSSVCFMDRAYANNHGVLLFRAEEGPDGDYRMVKEHWHYIFDGHSHDSSHNMRILYDAMERLTREHPDVSTVINFTDNGSSYHTNFSVTVERHFGNLFSVDYEHHYFEVGEGKSELDRIFGTMKFIQLTNFHNGVTIRTKEDYISLMRAVKGMRVFVITFHAYKERLVHQTFKQITAYKEFHFAAGGGITVHRFHGAPPLQLTVQGGVKWVAKTAKNKLGVLPGASEGLDAPAATPDMAPPAAGSCKLCGQPNGSGRGPHDECKAHAEHLFCSTAVVRRLLKACDVVAQLDNVTGAAPLVVRTSLQNSAGRLKKRRFSERRDQLDAQERQLSKEDWRFSPPTYRRRMGLRSQPPPDAYSAAMAASNEVST